MFISSSAVKFLLECSGKKVVNHGPGAWALWWPLITYVFIPAVRRVVVRVTDPAAALRAFAFRRNEGIDDLGLLLANLARGVFRVLVSNPTFRQCVDQRDTALSEPVAERVRRHVWEGSWGLGVDRVQVAQVYVWSDELRHELHAELAMRAQGHRNALHALEVEHEIMSKRAHQELDLEAKPI